MIDQFNSKADNIINKMNKAKLQKKIKQEGRTISLREHTTSRRKQH